MLCLPAVAAAAAGLAAGRLLEAAAAPTRVLAVMVASLAVAVLAEVATRRFLPLHALLRMSMLFPGRAPSRLAVARLGRDRGRVEAVLRSSAPAEEVAAAMLALVTALGRHDRRTRGHSERVRMLTDLLAEQLRLPQQDRDRLRWAALLHDIGKLDIAASVLSKPSRLDADEWALMREHPTSGLRLAGPFATWLGEWAGGIGHHHERWDGAGYPDGLAGTHISRAGRLVGVVDAFETMTAARSYKRAGSTRAALAELTRCAGTQFDPAAVRAFIGIPLPRLWWATGPLGLVLQVPVVGSAQQAVVQVSGSVVAASGAGAAAAGTAAVAAGTAAVVGVGGALALAPLAATAAEHLPALSLLVGGTSSTADAIGTGGTSGTSGTVGPTGASPSTGPGAGPAVVNTARATGGPPPGPAPQRPESTGRAASGAAPTGRGAPTGTSGPGAGPVAPGASAPTDAGREPSADVPGADRSPTPAPPTPAPTTPPVPAAPVDTHTTVPANRTSTTPPAARTTPPAPRTTPPAPRPTAPTAPAAPTTPTAPTTPAAPGAPDQPGGAPAAPEPATASAKAGPGAAPGAAPAPSTG